MFWLWGKEINLQVAFFSAEESLTKDYMNSLQGSERLKILPYKLNSGEDECESKNEADGADGYAGYRNYVRNDDIIIFESQAALKGTTRVYLRFGYHNNDCVISKKLTELRDKPCRYYIRQISQCAFEKEWHQIRSDEYRRKWQIGPLNPDSPRDHSHLGQVYMYAFKHLQQAADQFHPEAFYNLGKYYWRLEKYQKALDMYEAALFSLKSAYRELGAMYHTGVSTTHQTIGDELEIPVATSAVGRIKHILANATNDPSERDELRREVYEAFEKAAMDDPYAKFMVATYISNGWGGQQPNPVLGFDMFLSLVETGANMALHGIAKCYELGVGVERDLAKASAYQGLAAQMNKQ
ncbi:hypothetical protein DFQ30_000079 [Apophysomyces sp. BC1015]|nr:hypothetical protein DFQ30_000079 [Apophysomyces sp. BC1015]